MVELVFIEKIGFQFGGSEIIRSIARNFKILAEEHFKQ